MKLKDILDFLKEYWVLIMFFTGEIGALIVFVKSIHRGTRCSLRNDIVEIYEQCKPTKTITKYQLETACLSYKEYKRLKGNSFIDIIMGEIEDFEIIN